MCVYIRHVGRVHEGELTVAELCIFSSSMIAVCMSSF